MKPNIILPSVLAPMIAAANAAGVRILHKDDSEAAEHPDAPIVGGLHTLPKFEDIPTTTPRGNALPVSEQQFNEPGRFTTDSTLSSRHYGTGKRRIVSYDDMKTERLRVRNDRREANGLKPLEHYKDT